MAAKKRATKKSKASTKKGTHIAYDGTNFSKILPHFKGGPAVVINVLVHMDGCGPCQRLMGPYKKAVSNAPSDAVNVSVERQQLEKFNEDLRKNVEDAVPIEPSGFPTIVKVDNSGKILSAVNPSPANIGSLTTNSKKSLNDAMNGVPNATNSLNVAINSVPNATNSMNVIPIATSPMNPPSGKNLMNLVEEEDTDEDDVASVYNSSKGNSPLMTGGRAYAALAAAGHRLRKSKKTGRKTRHRKTRHRKTSRKTGRRS
jgi:hypothetical protein